MITSMRGCVAYNDLWPWPISSRSFGLGLENRVRSVQMITSIKRCVPCDDLWPWLISSSSFYLDFENHVRSVIFSVLDQLFFWLGIQYGPIVWVIMRWRGYPQNAGVVVVLVYSTLIPHHKPVEDITSFNMAKDIWQNVATLRNVEMASANKTGMYLLSIMFVLP